MAVTGRLLKTAKDLISIESVKSRPEKLKECIAYAKKFFKGQNVRFQEFEFAEKPSIVVTAKRRKNAGLFFLIHLDVVEAEKRQFKPAVKKGMLFGRGSGDMKTNAAIAMHAFKETFANHSVGLIITTDEEIGGFNGAEKIAGKVKPEFVIGTEPTQNGVVVKEKGILLLKIKASGKAAHGSRPWLGENAIEKLMKDLQAIGKLFKKASARNYWIPTMNIGKISGGDAANKVPDSAKALVDIRFTENFRKKEFLGKLKRLKIDFEILENEPLMETKKSNYFVQKLARIHSRNSGRKIHAIKENGASDGRFFSARGIPTVMLGIPCLSIHGSEESINVSEIQKIYKTYREIAEQF